MATKEKVIFDTNFLFNKKASSFFANKRDLELFTKYADILVPEIVIEELEAKYKRAFYEEKDKYLKTLLPSITQHNINGVDVHTRIAELKKSETIEYSSIALTDFSILPKMKDFAISKKPPFESANNTDKGFKDAYIYFTVLELLSTVPDEHLFVCSKDIRFRDAFKEHENITVVQSFEEYKEESKALILDEYLVSKINEKLDITLKSDFIIDYWENVDLNNVYQIVDDEFEEYIFEIESREIINHAKHSDYSQSVDDLIDSPNFGVTHAVIDILERYITLLSDDEIVRILEATIVNSQISWIIGDEDVKQFIITLYQAKKDILNEIIKEGIENLLNPKVDESDYSEDPEDDLPF